MQTNVRRLFEERQRIKANSVLATLRTARLLLSFILVCLLALLLVFFLIDTIFGSGQHFSKSPFLFSFMLVLVANALNLANNIAQKRYWERIEQRRFAAVQGNRTLLAAEHPMSNAASLPLPITIKLRYSKEFLLFNTGVALLLALLLAVAFIWFNNGPLPFTSNRLLFFPVSFLILVVLVLVPCIAIFIAITFTPLWRQQLEVTESGLTARYDGGVSSIAWDEARLFAVYGTFGAQKSGAVITYELSSARAIVRWTWVKGKSYFMGLEPTAPFDEYYLQMQALQVLVTAKTGLALYDLR